ncbi:hypothetical protein D3C78_823630 [compost metagenome]
MLADHIGRCTHLVVVHFIERRDQVGLLVHGAVEGVHAHHQRLWRALLGDHRPGVFPQRKDARLREVIADLVVHRVELDVGRLVDARAVGGERGGTAEVDTTQALAAEVFARGRGLGKAFAAVVHAGFEEGGAGGWQCTIGAKCLGHRLAARDQGKAWVLGLGVELHGSLLDVGALFG